MLRHADAFHRFHRFRQRRFAARGRESERGWLAHRAHKLPERHPRNENHKPENQHDKNDERQVKGEHQIAEINEHPGALCADRVRHRCADTKGREHHHVVGKLEHDLGEAFHRANDWLSFLANRRDGQREKHRERDDLKYVAVHHRFDNAGREHMHDSFNQRLGMALADRFDDAGIARCESDAHSWFREIHYGQSDEQCGGRYELEINQRLHAHPSDFSQSSGASDSNDNG